MKRAILTKLQEARAAKRPVALVTSLQSHRQAVVDGGDAVAGTLILTTTQLQAVEDALQHDRSGRLPDPDGELMAQVFNPPLRLLIVGAVHIAQALAPMAVLAGYGVSVVDPRRAFASPERFATIETVTEWPDDALEALQPDSRTAVVTLTHDPKLDDPALLAALKSKAFYIGSLGSTRTHARRLERLAEAGASEADLGRIHGPVGLPLGGRSPAEIAVAILAQMTQVLHAPKPERVQAPA